MKKKVMISLSNEAVEQGKELATLNGKSFSAVVEEAIRDKYYDEAPRELMSYEEYNEKYFPKGAKTIMFHNIAKGNETSMTTEEFIKQIDEISDWIEKVRKEKKKTE